jgi:hypothetical protein
MNTSDEQNYVDEKTAKDEYESDDITQNEHITEKEPEQMLVSRNTFLGKLYQRFFKLGVEARGVERVLEEDRSPKNALNNLLMWFSVNTGKGDCLKLQRSQLCVQHVHLFSTHYIDCTCCC